MGADRDVDIEAVAAAATKRVELGDCELGMKPIGRRVITTAGDERPPHLRTLRSVRHGQLLSMGPTYHIRSSVPAGLRRQKRLVRLSTHPQPLRAHRAGITRKTLSITVSAQVADA